MNKIFLTFLLAGLSLTLFTTQLNAQEITKKNSIYAELGGNGGLYSFNYDRVIDLSTHLKFAPRVGFSFLGGSKINLPIEANLLWGKNSNSKNFGEIGAGVTFISHASRFVRDFELTDGQSNTKNTTAYISRLGYRHQKPEGGFMYRLGFNLIFHSESKNKVIPFGGVSLGYAF